MDDPNIHAYGQHEQLTLAEEMKRQEISRLEKMIRLYRYALGLAPDHLTIHRQANLDNYIQQLRVIS